MVTPNPNPNHPSAESLSLESLQEQQLTLKLAVDELQTKLRRTRALIQTLLLGLLVAVLVALGVAGWLAYRLLVQEQIAQRDLEQAAINATAIEERLEELEGQLQVQSRQLQTVREDLPAELETLTETVQTNRRQLQVLRDRLLEAEPLGDTPAAADTPEEGN